jgi:cytochrome c oxidase subunit 2
MKSGLIFLFAIALSFTALAQDPDSTMASNTAATEAATAAQDTGIAAPPAISLDIDTAKLSWTGGGVIPKDNPEMKAAVKSFWFYFLVFALLCTFIGIIGKVLRVYELSNGVSGKEPKFNKNRLHGTLLAIGFVVGLYGAYWSYTVQGPMSVTASASVHGALLDKMFYTTLIITTIVFVLTHVLLLGFSYLYAGSEKRKAYFYPHNNMIERVWTIVPAFVLAGLVLFGFLTWRSITNVSPADEKAAVSLEVTGQQFNWNIRYAGADNQLGLRNYKLTTSDNGLGIDFTDKKSWDDKLTSEIVLPVNKPARITVNSKDIIHSLYMPDFKAQINAVPGMTTYFQFTPTVTTQEMRVKRGQPDYDYTLLCAKICGMGHYNMQAKVTIVTEEEYKAWLEKLPLYYNDEVKAKMAAHTTGGSEKKIALNR